MFTYRAFNSVTPTVKFLMLLLALTAARVTFLFSCGLELYADEAQYWIWSKNLDWGYYSKPPVIAWVICLTTSIFGDAEWFVRLSAPFLHLFTSITVYFIGKELDSEKLGIYSALGYATLPSVFLSSFIISTDAPLMFMWALALLMFIRVSHAERGDKLMDWVLLGFFVGLGMLTKYHMAIFGLCGLVFILISNKFALLRNPKLYLSIVVAFIVWLPNLIWNFENHLVSFNHTLDLASGGANAKLSLVNLGKFLLAQLGVFGPILFGLFVYIAFKRGQSKLLISFSVPFILVFFGMAFFSRAHGNWAAPAYIAATILVMDYLLKRDLRKVYNVSLVLHVIAGLVFMLWPLLGVNYYDPFKRLKGGEALGAQLSHYQDLYPNVTFASDNRKDYTIFVYYTQPHMFDLKKWQSSNGLIKDHFDLKSNLNTVKNGDVILISNHLTKPALTTYADSVKYVGELNYGADKHYKLYYLKNFKGY